MRHGPLPTPLVEVVQRLAGSVSHRRVSRSQCKVCAAPNSVPPGQHSALAPAQLAGSSWHGPNPRRPPPPPCVPPSCAPLCLACSGLGLGLSASNAELGGHTAALSGGAGARLGLQNAGAWAQPASGVCRGWVEGSRVVQLPQRGAFWLQGCAPLPQRGTGTLTDWAGTAVRLGPGSTATSARLPLRPACPHALPAPAAALG